MNGDRADDSPYRSPEASGGGPPPLHDPASYSAVPYRDNTFLANSLRALLIVSVFVGFAAIWATLEERSFLQDVDSGKFNTQLEAENAGEAVDRRTGMVGLAQIGVTVLIVVMSCVWIFRVARNVRALGARNLQFTPGWAVGWYFVPFLNLIRPYQAMKEIYQASVNPRGWDRESIAGILPLWWGLWIISGIVNQISFRLTLRAEELPDFMAANTLSLGAEIVDIPSALIFAGLIGVVQAAQQSARYGAAPDEGYSGIDDESALIGE